MAENIHIVHKAESGSIVVFRRDNSGDPVDPTPEEAEAIRVSIANDPVIADPHADISRVKFHSSLNYVYVKDVWSGSLSIPATNGNQPYVKHTLFSHSLGYTPLVFGAIRGYGGYDLPVFGSVLLKSNRRFSGRTENPAIRYFALGSDSVSVFGIQTIGCALASGTAPGFTLSLDVFVTDQAL